MKQKKIVLKPYTHVWKQNFLKIRKRLQKVLTLDYAYIHHIGSTSVEGLAAKPIIDIDIEMKGSESFQDVSIKLSRLGYRHVGDQGIPGREVFKLKKWSLLPKHHVYVCASNANELKRHIGFRDYLRKHPEMKSAYQAIKIEAAKKHPYDMDAYLRMKGIFIQNVYRQLGLDSLSQDDAKKHQPR